MRPQGNQDATCLQRKGARCSEPGSGSKSVGSSPRGKKIVRDKLEPKRREIFLHEQRSNKEISKDIIRADCMNHGYRIEKSVGEGAYAKVKSAEVLPAKLARNETLAELAEDIETYLQVAIKVIESKQVPKEFLRKFLPRELSNHCPLEPHKNVVRVFEQFRTTERVYVVMEYCNNGDLLDLINQRTSESHRGIGEDRARDMFKQMVDGVQHIHNNGIVHRDLKCENILISDNFAVKLTDFGFSTKYDDKESFLRTSCGSYAYTAPEVIKSKPYNGFKSDTWSLGVILFAMLNGRLPFNDSQLMEMEEDMKMQRLRFERNVSFDAMVLVRRILQYCPTQRPALQEILNDPWMTGKKMIPRQINRTKWINPYEAKTEETDITDEEVVGSNPVYYKATVPERGHDATVTVKHEGNETVMLKSRRIGQKKNIWTSGPAVVCQNRPSTWPKSVKESEQTTKRNQDRLSRGPRATVRHASANTTVIVKSQPKNRKTCTQASNASTRVSDNAVHMSKWFMEKFMKKSREGEGMNKTTERKLSECNYCKSDDSIQDMASQNQTAPKTASNNTTAQKTASASQNQTIQKSLNQVSRKTVSQNQRTTASQNKSAHATGSQNKTAQKPALQRPKQTNSTRTVKSEDNEQAQEHDPDRLMIDFGLFEDEMNLQDSVDDPEPSPDIEVSIVKRGPSRGSAGSVMTQSSSRGKGPTSGQGSKKGQDRMQTSPYTRSSNSQEVKRKSLTMSANVKGTGYRKSGTESVSPTASKSLDLPNKSLYKYMVNRSTNPAERVKYFRERIMKLYGNSIRSNDDRAGLPPLICQAIRPPTASKERGPVRAWSSGSRVKTDNVRTKPIQRVVVHSAS